LLLAACSTPGPGPNAAASLPVVSPDVPANLQSYYAQRISFSTCPTNNDVQCGWVNVPIDYQNVGLGSMRLRVAYHPGPAVGPRRLGFLFTNPGGPGASGLDIPYDPGGYVSTKVIGQFDVLGWDPRGVGQSDPIRCLTNEQKDAYVNLNATPTTPAEISQFVAAQKALGLACKVRNPKTYDHVGTVAAAHDMDIIRAALGQREMYYLGYSYGTVLGAWYAEQFPKRVTRMVLDGAMNPALDNTQSSFEQMRGFENALYRFLDWCPTSGGCPKVLRLPEQQQRINVILAEQNLLAKQPAPTGDKNRPLTESLFQTGMVYALYDNTFGWPQLAFALNDLLMKGNGAAMLDLADAYLRRDPKGTYPGNDLDAFNAITCYDKPPTPAVAGTLALVKTWSASYPVLGANFAWANLTCANWPAHTELKPAPLAAKGAAPIVVVGTTYDPATPYNEAVALASQLASGHLITWIGDGHTAYNRGSDCVQHAVDDYLLHGFVPKAGLVCPAISPPK
jgi:pimeloyl-ACP methyl ester carboxylesterase